jgi:predicted MPP superfamily phosphohydrolase
MSAHLRHIPDIVVFLLAMGVQFRVFRKIFGPAELLSRWGRLLQGVVFAALAAGLAWTLADVFLAMPPLGIKEPLLWMALSTLAAALLTLPLPDLPEKAERRAFLTTAARTAVAAPLVITGLGAMARKDFQVREVEAAIPGLPRDLDRLRIVQLTDIHLSPLLDRRDLARAVDMANELRAHLAVITGDLITSRGDPLDDALAELARLKADAGIYGCHGNHEIYAGALGYCTAAGARLGIRFLRQRQAALQFGGATLNLVGVDYQRRGWPYLVNAEKFVDRSNVNVLLSHNPDVFPEARRKGFALTLAGHTHGGQVNVEILDTAVNVARFYTPYTRGLYQEDGSSLYVSAGIGTVGIPVRLGAPAEVSLVKLCAI